jgi:hypothetical protein
VIFKVTDFSAGSLRFVNLACSPGEVMKTPPPGRLIVRPLPFRSSRTSNAHSPKTIPAGRTCEPEALNGGIPPVFWALAGGNAKMHEMAETTEATTHDVLRMGRLLRSVGP